MNRPHASPAVWSLAGHDPFGGAGIQADMRVAAALNQDLRTIITSFTAQNDNRVFAAEPSSIPWLDKQWEALAAMEHAAAYKVGLLLNTSTINWLADTIRPEVPLIVDPVFKTSSGTSFLGNDILLGLREYLFPAVDLLTPNRPEAEAIVGFSVKTLDDVKRAAVLIRSQGVKAVLIKGGHSEGETLYDYFDDGGKPFDLSALRKPGNFRGTGCTLSTAIACYHAQGLGLRDAVVAAHSYVQAAIARAAEAELSHLASEFELAPLSELFYGNVAPDAGPAFAPLCRSLGFYPVLPSVEWIARLARTGVKTVQLRLKDKSEAELGAAIAEAKKICEANDIALFVNDAWRLALEHKIFGVHLGQEDLDCLSAEDLESIRASGLRLGLSTHSLEEAARAKRLRPSYIALGPVFETTSKSMRFGPQGISRVGEWVRRLPAFPIVAIGGLTLEHAEAVLAQGADGIAVISDLIQSKHPEQRMNEWLAMFD